MKYPTDPAAAAAGHANKRVSLAAGNAPVARTQREFSRGLDRKNSLDSRIFQEFSLKNILATRRSPRGLPFNFFSRQRHRSMRYAIGKARDSRSKAAVLYRKRRLAIRHFLAVSRCACLLGVLDSVLVYFFPRRGGRLSGGLRDIYRGSEGNQFPVIPWIERV